MRTLISLARRGGLSIFRKLQIIFVLMILLSTFQLGLSSAAETQAGAEPPFSGIDFKDGLLRISVEKQKFPKVMDEIAKKARIRIVIFDSPANQDVTAHFDYLPLEKGLQRLLRGRNYVFLYGLDEMDGSSKLTQVFVYPKTDKQAPGTSYRYGENELGENREKYLEENHPLGQELLADLQEALSRHEEYLSPDVSEALEEIQDPEKFQQLMQELEEAVQNLPQEGVVTQEELLDALKGKKETDKKSIQPKNKPWSE